MAEKKSREQWGSRLGFILAAAGSAAGLGNIWRFPYITGENGGGAFVFVFLLCMVFIGLPLLWNEAAFGRLTTSAPVGAFKKTKAHRLWFIVPALCIAVCFFILSYYSVIAGWTIGYIYFSIAGTDTSFEEFSASPEWVLPLFAGYLLLTAGIVLGGISKGIERATKVLMPFLFVIIIVVIVRSLTLDGAMEGVRYYLKPDFSKITGHTFLIALGQTFFSLSVGWGSMIAYGSYLDKKENLVSAGIWIAGIDVIVALLGGLMIFPAVFALGKSPDEGSALLFRVLPEIFDKMPGGSFIGALFFLLVMVAALTSSLSTLEVPVSYLIDERKWNRKIASLLVAVLAFAAGVPAALSNGANRTFSEFTLLGKTGVLNVMDFFFGTYMLIIISLLISLYVGWSMKPRKVAEELSQNARWFDKKLFRVLKWDISLANFWIFFIRFVCPPVLVMMLVFQVSE